MLFELRIRPYTEQIKTFPTPKSYWNLKTVRLLILKQMFSKIKCGIWQQNQGDSSILEFDISNTEIIEMNGKGKKPEDFIKFRNTQKTINLTIKCSRSGRS